MPQECKCKKRNKRLIVCCDGTWQTPSQPHPTNVAKIAQAIQPIAKDGTPQIVYYSPGLGTRGGLDWIRGAFGHGLNREIKDAYTFLVLNYEEGDEIYMFGFSRGAYTVRSLAGFIYASGLLDRANLCKRLSEIGSITFKSPKISKQRQEYNRLYKKNLQNKEGILDTAYEIYRSTVIQSGGEISNKFRLQLGNQHKLRTSLSLWLFLQQLDCIAGILFIHGFFRVEINFLGCWDTVATLGFPGKHFIAEKINKMLNFHDYKLSSKILNARHAIALNEVRKVFNIIPMQTNEDNVLKQVWFPGDHGCVGGGCENQVLSQCTLQWMVDEIGHLQGSGVNLDIDTSTLPEHKSTACNLRLDTIDPQYNRGLAWWLTYIVGIKERSSNFLEALELKGIQSNRFSALRLTFQTPTTWSLTKSLAISWKSLSKMSLAMLWTSLSKRLKSAAISALELLHVIKEKLQSIDQWLFSEYPKIVSSIQRSIREQLEEIVEGPKPSSDKGFSSYENLSRSIQTFIGITQNSHPSDAASSANSMVSLNQADSQPQAVSHEQTCCCCGAPLHSSSDPHTSQIQASSQTVASPH